MKLAYRAEIDGLRAVAVLPVILFHAGFSVFSGGYVGVDVFFVISGYLITSILLADMQGGKFSLLNFYERRARRILPALFLVLAVCTPIAWALLIRKPFVDYFQSLAAVPLFLSNVLFWGESGYFDTASELKPLLHTWSLAIEEQFYVIFPLMLFALWKWARSWMVPVLAGIGLMSLALAHFGASRDPAATFFLLHTRFWELLIGCLAAIYLSRAEAVPRNDWLAGLGLVLILFSIFAFDAQTPFPSLYALAPTVGTALIILFAGPGGVTTRLLSLPVLVGIGLISYSAYLWHQPLFAFARHAMLSEPPDWLMLVLGAAALGLAGLTWKFVEQPFRGKANFTRWQIFGLSAAGSALFFAIGVYGSVLRGPVYPPQLASIYEDAYQDTDPCVFYNGFDAAGVETCLTRAPGKPKAILIGDSHAHAMSATMRAMLDAKGYDLLTLAYDGCLPIAGTTRLPLEAWRGCNDFKAQALQVVASQPGAPVIISTRWSHYLEGDTFDNTEGGVEPPLPGKTFVVGDDGEVLQDAPLIDHILSEIEQLSYDHKIILLTQVPETGWHTAFHVDKSIRIGRELTELTTPYAAYKARNRIANEALPTITGDTIKLIETHKLVCDTALPDRCLAYYDRDFYYRDDNHSSTLYSKQIAEEVGKALD